MRELNKNNLIITSSPHILSPETTSRIMWAVFFCLIPSGLVSVFIFGFSTGSIIICAILGALITEAFFCLIQKKALTINDGSAALTGLLLAYNLPAQSPAWLAFLGSFVAIFVGKVLFGGLGCNIFNPALIGRVFLMASFPALMTRWPAPFRIDAVTSPTPLAIFKESFKTTNFLPGTEGIDYSYQDLFFGFRGGCIGEACIVLLLLGAAYLLYKRYITWHIPFSYIATLAIFTWIFAGGGYFRGDFLFHILSGGLILGAFFMATDYVTSPITKKGQIIFGLGCGLITGIIRLWGGYPEGVSYSILLMNSLAPLMDRFITPKRFGDIK